MEQHKFPIRFKQEKNNNEEQVQSKKIPYDYHTLDRAGKVIQIRLLNDHNRIDLHMHRRMNLLPTPLCACGTEGQTIEHILEIWLSYQHRRELIWSDRTSLHQKLYGKKE